MLTRSKYRSMSSFVPTNVRAQSTRIPTSSANDRYDYEKKSCIYHYVCVLSKNIFAKGYDAKTVKREAAKHRINSNYAADVTCTYTSTRYAGAIA